MFGNWMQEKATLTLIDEAQTVADKLATAKPHVLDGYSAAMQFWAASYLADGVDLHELSQWKPATAERFAKVTATRIAALRKKREYDSSDGLAIWLHTARAVTEPRIAPMVRDIWERLSEASSNADMMADDLLQEAGLPPVLNRSVPQGFEVEE